jgi:hypothetical protein
MGEAMDTMSPTSMNLNDSHVCITASFNHHDA